MLWGDGGANTNETTFHRYFWVQKSDFRWISSEIGDSLGIYVKVTILHFSREKTRKSWNRAPGLTSREAAKVLCLIRVWGGYFRRGLDFSESTPFW